MIRKIPKITIFAIMVTLLLSSCTPVVNSELEEELEAKNSIISTLEGEIKLLEEKVDQLEEAANIPPTQILSNSLLSTSLEVVDLIKNKDIDGLSNYVHPSKGLRFSPYGYVDVQLNQVFTIAQVSDLMTDPQIFSWGSYDGTGDPIDLSFSDYYKKFVYDLDFANPHMIGNNVLIGTGNTLNNIGDVYPNGRFIEFHFTGTDPQYEGMDWRSLKLVFEKDNGTWYLIGIVHDQWTI